VLATLALRAMSKIGKSIAKTYKSARGSIRKAANSEFGKQLTKRADQTLETAATAAGHGRAYKAARNATVAEYGGSAKSRSKARKNLKQMGKDAAMAAVSGK
jgi:hypothetical protein